MSRTEHAVSPTYTMDIFTAGADVLVNPVNCVGVAGCGLALQFRQRYPKHHDAYFAACQAGDVQLGRSLLSVDPSRLVVHFPTKLHWRDRSHLADIAAGLDTLAEQLVGLGGRVIALPALGCGAGGLWWSEVHPLLQRFASRGIIPSVIICPPLTDKEDA